MKTTKRLLALLLVLVFFVLSVPMGFAEDYDDALDAEYTDDEDADNEEEIEDEEDEEAAAYELLNNEGTGYFYFYRDNIDSYEIVKDAPITMSAVDAAFEGAEKVQEDGVDALLMKGVGTNATFTFQVEKEGLYAINVQYKPIPASGKPIDWSVLLDGKVPYDELDPTTLPLIWEDDMGDSDAFRLDEDGNELRPSQIEKPHWTDRWLQDTTGQYNEPYLLYMTPGEHTLTFTIDEQSLYFSGITLGYPESAMSYKEYKETLKNVVDEANEILTLEVEHSMEKSSSMLYPTYDRSTPATTPNNPGATCLNTIGGGNWKSRGDYITWEIDVEKAGWYNIAFRGRQNFNEGLVSYRSLRVDGQQLFTQAENVEFKYSLDWKVNTLGDGKTPVYFTPGKHTITMTVGSGDVAKVLRELNQVVLDLNTLYRKIIMITSVSPDIYQDYNLPDNIPGLMVAFDSCADRLESMSKQMKKITGSEGGKAYLFDEMAVMLRDFIKTPFSIAERLSNYKSQLESLGSLLLTLGEMPVELDKIYLVPKTMEIPNGKCSLWESMVFGVQAFFASFSSDYATLPARDEDGNANIQVWISSGRDQAQIIRRLIDDGFTAETGTKIQLSITDTGTTLIQATLAGKGPHAALCIPKDTPVNLAMRDGLVNLLPYGAADLMDEYQEYAFEPYRYNNGKVDGLYALPETQTFNMMFYRTDIFKELGLSVPSTWEEFYKCIEVIQGSNLNVGMMETNSALIGTSSAIDWFAMFLFQNGGTYFDEGMTKTRFDEELALDSFTTVVELYKEYGLDRQFDFYNRFRSGEMPLGITSYTQYNMLSYAAPEINGLWAMAPVPATVREDGTLDRTVSSGGTGCIMLHKAVTDGIDKETYEFLKWWASGAVQGTYGTELEATMGPAMRYSPANKTAFEKIPWSSEERQNIATQWAEVYDVREIPGNYYIGRSLTSALRMAIDNDVSARRQLLLYNEEINAEITRKREEFGLQ